MYEEGRGIVLNEPSVIAINKSTGDVLEIGRKAWQMIGRTPSNIVAVRPLRNGAITDFETTQRMIRLILEQVGVSRFGRTRVVICVPSVITAVERRAVIEAARRAGASDVRLMEQPIAAAIGADLPIHEPVGSMVVDIGGGTSESAMLSLGGAVSMKAIRVGSFAIDAAIQTFTKNAKGVVIGERTAEEIKVAIGSAYDVPGIPSAEVRGRDIVTGLPKTFLLTAEEIREAISEQTAAIVDSVVSCLSESPPELAQDIIERGICLVGGGALLKGLDRRLFEEAHVPVYLVNAPLETVVLGAGRCLESFNLLSDMFMN